MYEIDRTDFVRSALVCTSPDVSPLKGWTCFAQVMWHKSGLRIEQDPSVDAGVYHDQGQSSEPTRGHSWERGTAWKGDVFRLGGCACPCHDNLMGNFLFLICLVFEFDHTSIINTQRLGEKGVTPNSSTHLVPFTITPGIHSEVKGKHSS